MKIVKEMLSPKRENETLSQRIWRITGGDILYFLSFSIFLAGSVLSTSFYYRYFDGLPFMWVQILCVVLLAAYEVRSGGLKTQQWTAFALAAVLCLISWRVAEGNLHRLVTLMFPYIYCARSIPFRKVAAVALNVSAAVFTFIIASALLGVVENMVSYYAGRVRWYLGFRYVLYPSGILLNLTALWIYLKRDTMTLGGAVFWGVANFALYQLTNSRISFVISEVLILGGLVLRYLPVREVKTKALWAILSSSFFLCAAFSIIVVLCYHTHPWMEPIDTFLAGRVSLADMSLREFGVTWFGQRIQWVGSGLSADGFSVDGTYNYVDCLYVKVLQRYGIVFSVVLLGLVCWAMYRLWKRREYHILLICATVAVHCVLDDLSFSLHYNTFWMAMGLVLMDPAMLDWQTAPDSNQSQ